jgi:hypothetical protein
MLKIESEPRFTMPVEVNTRAIKGTFTVEFRARKTSELQLIEQQTAEDGSGVTGFLKKVVSDVRDIELPDGLTDGPWPDSLLGRLTDWPAVGVAMQRAYYRGLWEEEAKN